MKEALQGASEEAKRRIRDLEAHPGGEEELWPLHQLDIEDKHQLLIPVGMAYGSLNLHATFRGFEGGGPVEFPPIEIAPADRMYTLREGHEVFRVANAARRDGEMMQTQYSFTFDVAFGGESLAAAGKSIKLTLPDLVEHAERQELTLL